MKKKWEEGGVRYVRVCFGAGLKPTDKPIFLTERVQLFLVDLCRFNIALIGAENDGQWLPVGQDDFGIDLFLPFGYCIEGAGARHVINEHSAQRVLVVDPGNGTEAVLAGNVPQLDMHDLFVYNDTFQKEVFHHQMLLLLFWLSSF